MSNYFNEINQAANKRKYVCFVCGESFENLEEYKNHILDEHEEGRDYVKCPLERCGYPVRDLRTHYKSRHPHEKLPKCSQMRAIVWKDHSNRRKKTMKFKEGYYTSAKNNGKSLHFRSGYERDVYEALEKFEEVVSYGVEKVAVPYLFEGETHHYYPDLIINFSDGHIEIWEVKPLSQVNLERNEKKWTSCQNFCEARNWDFKIITESAIKQLKKGIMV
jgi:DNA-directed RNA polymerase subunit RPC12/RpoP